MRKALLALVLTGLICLASTGAGAAQAALEPTDSGAPSAIMMFPVGEKPNPRAAAMAPVAFNHVVHEKWMAKANQDCIVCHHTGDPVACTECHTVQGSEKAKFVTLYRAMHSEFIQPRRENTPSSCVSCHIRQTRQRECAGCHDHLVGNRRDGEQWCNVCHTVAPSAKPEQIAAGIANKLPFAQNEALATATVLGRKQAQYWSSLVAPYKVEINVLENQYGACLFNHRHHAFSLYERIRGNQLASAFHVEKATICTTCHHHSPASATPPKCSSCHSTTISWRPEGRPNLMAAFHLQCMNCHQDMKVARPRNTDCATCHKPRTAAQEQGSL